MQTKLELTSLFTGVGARKSKHSSSTGSLVSLRGEGISLTSSLLRSIKWVLLACSRTFKNETAHTHHKLICSWNLWIRRRKSCRLAFLPALLSLAPISASQPKTIKCKCLNSAKRLRWRNWFRDFGLWRVLGVNRGFEVRSGRAELNWGSFG